MLLLSRFHTKVMRSELPSPLFCVDRKGLQELTSIQSSNDPKTLGIGRRPAPTGSLSLRRLF